MMSMQKVRHLRQDRGVVAVEFALVAPLFLLLLLSAIDFGRAYYVKQSLLNGAGAAARLAAMSTSANLTAAATAAAPGVAGIAESTAPMSVSPATSSATACAAGSSVTVTTRIDFLWITPLQWIRGSSTTGNRTTLSAAASWQCVNT